MSNLLGLENDIPNASVDKDNSELEQAVKNGANWFYWIAGLSLFNSLLFAFGTSVSFLTGLGFALVMDVFVGAVVDAGGSPLLRIVSTVTNFVLVAAFALFGYYAGKQFKGAFLAGIILYLLDIALVLLLEEYLMAGFHAFALIFIGRGYLACRSLDTQRRNAIASTGP